MTTKLDEMVRGYLNGLDWTSPYEPSALVHESPAYRHGFENGRSDRAGEPRERANVLMRRARMILGEEA